MRLDEADTYCMETAALTFSSRTGIDILDDVIEAFLAATVSDTYWDRDPIAVSDFAFDPGRGRKQLSAGWCGAATIAFNSFAKQHLAERGIATSGLEALVRLGWTNHDISGHVHMHDMSEMPFGPLDEYGSPVDETLSSSHCLTIMFCGDWAYMVDFTASQYGYDALPLVRRASAEAGMDLCARVNEPAPGTWAYSWER